ncbi:unnamed protein product [Adineta steineri]|uniref:Uncharacterized protein n=2 Tax=Adineta steineri TaxID=433720 RepID=A0A815IUA4_9BILA|nr:unnamed protein product [Adineta steineri]CAF1363106.1 unnamed protein product [Adineta steineri]CAF1368132.1 unnamed protein product [Adineta steineri]
MATANNKRKCFTCDRENNIYTCEGCSKRFCYMDLAEHQQRLNDELNHISHGYNEFKQRINEHKQNPQNDALIKQIDQWEINSIETIQQKAQNFRKIVLKSSQTFINDIENKFNDLNKQIQQLQKANDFNEINLNYLKNQLTEITHELNHPVNISIQQNSQSFISDISIISSKKSKFNKWKQNGITVAGGNKEGQKLNQLNGPVGMFIDKNKNIFIADRENNRIVEWKCNAKQGQIIAGGNKKGDRFDQLNCPTDVIIDQQTYSIIIADNGNSRVIQWFNQKQQILIDDIDCYGLAIDKHGYLYISDWKKSEVRRWKIGDYDNEGIIVAGGNGQGHKLDQFNCPTFIFVDEDQSVYVSDRYNNRVMKWRKGAKEGAIVAGGNGEGRNLNHLSLPEGIVVDDLGQIYVADLGNDRIMRWCEGKEEGEVVVSGNGEENQLDGPVGLFFDDGGNLYVTDHFNHRIVKFEVVL